MTDWQWCYEHPKEAAIEIDRLRSLEDHLIAALVRISGGYGPDHLSRFCRDEATRALALIPTQREST